MFLLRTNHKDLVNLAWRNISVNSFFEKSDGLSMSGRTYRALQKGSRVCQHDPRRRVRLRAGAGGWDNEKHFRSPRLNAK